MLFSSQPISRPNNLCVEPSPLRHNWETGNGKFLKLDRGRFRREAEKARPEKPEGSTEGQAGLRARRRAWPSVPIGLVPIVRVVLVGQSREAVVTAQRPVRGDRLITSSACRWTMGPGRRSVQPDHREGTRKPRCHGVEASKLPSHGTADDTRTGCGGHSLASRRICASGLANLRSGPANLQTT